MLIYIIALLGVLAVVVKTLYTALRSDIRNIPGPWLAKYTDLVRTYYAWRGDNPSTLRRLQKQYGNAVRIGPNCILLSEKETFQQVLGFKEDFIKSDSMKPWQIIQNGKPVASIASTQDRKAHAELKRPVAGIFSMTSTVQFEPGVDSTIKYFLQRLDETFIDGSNAGKPCDIDNWVQYFAFDVVGDITLSRRLGFLEHGTDVEGMLNILNTEFAYRGWIQNMPWLDQWLHKNPVYTWLKVPTNPFIVRARGLIQSRLSQEKISGHPDFMDRFLEAQKKHPEVVTPQVLAGYVATNFFAGSDTTAVVMRAILYYTIRTPGVLEKLRNELDTSGTQYPVPFKTAQGLTYLDAIIREAMRIHFIGAMLMERVVPASGYTLPTGEKLAPGTLIGMNPWTLNFDTTIYGEDTEAFRPERWLKKDGESDDAFEKRLAYMKHNDFSFSYGPRACLGRHIATMEIYKIMPTLLGLLDMEFVNPDKEWRVEGSFFARQYDMDMRLSWRQGVNKEVYIE